jgi:hypothetical protein
MYLVTNISVISVVSIICYYKQCRNKELTKQEKIKLEQEKIKLEQEKIKLECLTSVHSDQRAHA